MVESASLLTKCPLPDRRFESCPLRLVFLKLAELAPPRRGEAESASLLTKYPARDREFESRTLRQLGNVQARSLIF